jgi:hypothetical protein
MPSTNRSTLRGMTVWGPWLLLVGLQSSEARAQYQSPQTGTVWNNPTSAWIADDLASGRPLRAKIEEIKQRQQGARRQAGALRIRRGEATTRFATVPFPTEAYMQRWKPGTPAERIRIEADLEVQTDIWRREAQARGARLDDIADSLALAFVLAYEVHSGGQRPAQRPYRWMAEDFRRTFLRDENFQGMPVEQKRSLQEGVFLDSTAAMLRWERGRARNDPALISRARDGAKAHLKRWWTASVDTLTVTPDRFLTPSSGRAPVNPPRNVADNSSARDARNHVPRCTQPHDELMFVPTADGAARFHYGARIRDPAVRAQEETRFERALKRFRTDIADLERTANPTRACSDHDVARSITYAVVKNDSLYWLSRGDFSRAQALEWADV